jgi:hypothetical protein
MITKADGERIAKELYSKGATVYVGKYSLQMYVDENEKVTKTAENKILKTFFNLVVNGTKYSSLDVMYAEERLKKLK